MIFALKIKDHLFIIVLSKNLLSTKALYLSEDED